MKELIIKFDFAHGPIWKDIYDLNTKIWITGIDVIDQDATLNELNDAAEKEYSSLYVFDDCGYRILTIYLTRIKKRSSGRWYLGS